MFDFLFSYGGYTPHGFCLAWDLRVLWTHIGADLLIALAYFSIPAVILAFLRKRKDPALTRPALLFTAFILLCGVTHLMGIVTLYVPLYGLQGTLKLMTGLVSAYTAFVLWRMLPVALGIPGRGELVAAIERQETEIAERRKAEEAAQESEAKLAQKVVELEAANAELSEFAYAASHDLKSPTNTLTALLEDLDITYGAEVPDEARAELAEARALTGRMRLLVDDILTYSQVVNGEDRREDVALGAVFDLALSDMASEIAASGAEIRIGDLPVVHGYPQYLGVLVRNLLSNALKFQDGSRRPEIDVVALNDGTGRQGFSMTDNGIGIDAVHQERIFQMFKRLHRQEDYPGTGLGLALCRRAVAAHGGTIDVASAPGQGTTFHVALESGGAHAELAA